MQKMTFATAAEFMAHVDKVLAERGMSRLDLEQLAGVDLSRVSDQSHFDAFVRIAHALAYDINVSLK